MSFASILSEPATDVRTPTMTPSIPKSSRNPSTSQNPSPAKIETAKDAAQKRETSVVAAYPTSDLATGPSIHLNGYTPAYSKPRRILTTRENEKVSKALVSIDEAAFSDVETTGFDAEKKQYIEKSQKRALEVDEVETRKRKVGRQKLRDEHETN